MTPSSPTSTRARWFVIASAGLLAMLLTLFLQQRQGFYTSDLGSDPDEPAHAVTSLMVRDYLAEALGQNPLRYAEAYYARFPKVALGHYPPLYYLVAGVWLLPVRSCAALGVLQALQVGLLAATTVGLMRNRLPMALATIAVVAWSVMPYLQKLSLIVMSDLQVALLCLWSALAWHQYLKTEKLKWSLAFGFLAAAAILTKGSAWSLALLPGLSLLLTLNWRPLLKLQTWAAVVPVAVLALPWQLWSSRITARGMNGLSPNQHFQEAVPFYAEALPRSLGLPVFVILICALTWALIEWLKGRRMDTLKAVLCSLLLATLVIVLLIPAGLTSRYLMPLFFPALALAVLETTTFTRWAADRFKLSTQLLQPAMLGLLAVVTGFTQPALYQKNVTGFDQAFESIVARSQGDSDLRMLAVTDARGEGALVAAAAFHAPTATQRIAMLRGSKELSDQDWMGRGFTLRAHSADEVLALLLKREVDWVVLENTLPQEQQTPVHQLVPAALAKPDSGWILQTPLPVRRSSEDSGLLQLYQRRASNADAQTPPGSTSLQPPTS